MPSDNPLANITKSGQAMAGLTWLPLATVTPNQFVVSHPPKVDAGRWHFRREMVAKITSLAGNGRQYYKFNSSRNWYTFVLCWY